MENFTNNCQNCAGKLVIKELQCEKCALSVSGEIKLPRLARLSAEDRRFIELFVLSAGSLKEVGKILNLSYPTVRKELDKVINNLRNLEKENKRLRAEILLQLEKGEISCDEALKALEN